MMGEVVRIRQGDTEPLYAHVRQLADGYSPLTGSTDIKVICKRESDGYELDWNDWYFKASGHTTKKKPMPEWDATDAAGTYRTSFPTPSLENDVVPDNYLFTIIEDSVGIPAAILPGPIEIAVGTWADQIAAIETDTQNIQSRVPAALIGGKMDSNIGAISGDTAAADNLEATYDGTGYTDPQAPAKQIQLDQLATGSSALNQTANSNSTITTGSTVSGDYTETVELDQVYWQIQDAAGVLDMYYEFALLADGVPVSVTFTGRVNGVNDDLDVFAWNWITSAWEQIGSLDGKALTTDDVKTYSLFTSHVGTSGSDVGKVRVRFYGTGLTSANFYTDQIFLSYSVVNRSVGYENGAIWVDTVNGQAGQVAFINGTADNPVDSWADALALSSSLGIKRFRIIGGSSITLTANSDYYQIIGAEYDLALNGQSITEAYIEGATVSGTSAGTDARFIDCKIDTVSLTQCGMGRCVIRDTVTLLTAGTYLFEGCFSGVAGVGTPFLDFGAAVGSTNVNIRHYSGGIEIKNMGQSGTDKMSLEGFGQLILNANCTGGEIAIRGAFKLTDNSGSVTLSEEARYSVQQIRDSMKLTPTAGSPSADSVDKHLDDILEDTADMQPKIDVTLSTLEDNIRGTDDRDLTDLAGTGYVKSTDSLAAAQDERAAIQDSVDDISNVTRFAATIPTLERPVSGSIAYKIRVNLEDTDGNPEDPDANTITVHAENHQGTSRDGNLGSTTMTRIAVGRYEVTYTVSDSHALEQLIFEFTYAEDSVSFTKDKTETVVDATEVGFTATDRTTLNNIYADTNAIDTRLPSDPADQSEVEAAITAAETALTAEINENETKIDALQSDITSIDADIAAVQAQCNKLDNAASTPPSACNNESILGWICNKDVTQSYARATDSLEATGEHFTGG